MSQNHHVLIDGRWAASAGRETFTATNPANGQPIPGDYPVSPWSELEQALQALDADRGFLKAGGVFTDDVIDAYIALKMQEVTKVRMSTHPLEFELYYSV